MPLQSANANQIYIMKVKNHFKFNGELISYNTTLIIGIIALLYSLIPVFLNSAYMEDNAITILLIFLNAPAVGIYQMALWYFPEYFIAKIACLFISTSFMWLLFMALWTNRMYIKRVR